MPKDPSKGHKRAENAIQGLNKKKRVENTRKIVQLEAFLEKDEDEHQKYQRQH
jgi:hypothetical protein